jgi:hypothetical protein
MLKKWQCTKCGKTITHPTTPTPSHGGVGKCKETSSGNHIWKEVK